MRSFNFVCFIAVLSALISCSDQLHDPWENRSSEDIGVVINGIPHFVETRHLLGNPTHSSSVSGDSLRTWFLMSSLKYTDTVLGQIELSIPFDKIQNGAQFQVPEEARIGFDYKGSAQTGTILIESFENIEEGRIVKGRFEFECDITTPKNGKTSSEGPTHIQGRDGVFTSVF